MSFSLAPFIIKNSCSDMHDIFYSRKFISKIFDIENREDITKSNGNIHIQKKYNVNDLQNMFTITPYINENIISKIKHIVFELNVHQSVIVNTDDVLIIKYICSIDKPTYIKSMLADQSTVYYIKFYKNTNNNEYLNMCYYRKFIQSDDIELYNDSDIINDNNILNNNSEYNTIKFNSALLVTASTLLGEDAVNDMIIPFIYKIYDDFIDIVINKRIKNYLKHKKIELLKKKN